MGGRPHPPQREPTRRRKILLASGRQGATPGRGLQGAGDRRGSGSPGRAEPVSSAAARSAGPASRRAPPADMCAARMPPLAHVFRGTFVHATWTSPMEVLRDHLLGVSDSGRVSGAGPGGGDWPASAGRASGTGRRGENPALGSGSRASPGVSRKKPGRRRTRPSTGVQPAIRAAGSGGR